MAEIISGVYKITNTVTNDFYIGSSKNVKLRWANHKCPSILKKYPNNPLYLDMKKYGVDKFDFQILEEAEPVSLKEKEQCFIETLKPTYNDKNAKGLDIGRKKEYQKSDKNKKRQKEYDKKYKNQLCSYNGEILTLAALVARFYRAGIEHPTKEAKKYILNNSKDK